MKLIDKDVLVAEIENLRKHYIERDDFDNGWNMALDKILSFLDTLEVKEIDLESQVKDFCHKCDERKEKWYELCPNDRKLLSNPTWSNFAMSIAKYFFDKASGG